MATFGKLPFQVAFDPTTGFILDARQYFESYDEAVKAAKSAKEVGTKETVYHYGMQLLVDDGTTVTWYIITRSNTLEPLCSGSGSNSGSSTGECKLPDVTEADEGKFLKVSGAKWVAADLPKYDGEYSVSPSPTEDQLLKTGSTFVDADIKINKIPYSEVSNSSNGITVAIGG